MAIREKRQPDLLLLGNIFPDGTGLEILPSINSWAPFCRIVFFREHHQDNFMLQALQKGAIGYITTDVSTTVILQAMRCASESHFFIPACYQPVVLTSLRRGISRQGITHTHDFTSD